jgi:hypothetical protein
MAASRSITISPMVFEGDVGLAHALEPTDDARYHLVDPLRLDRALLERDAHRALKLVAIEVLALAVRLDDDEVAQLHPLVGGEAAAAGRAEAPPPDRDVILRGPRVLHLGVDISAKRAAHRPPPSLVPSPRTTRHLPRLLGLSACMTP